MALSPTASTVGTTLVSASMIVSALAMDIRWGTSRVGSSGHRAVTHLTQLLQREIDGYTFTVQPTPGAIPTVKGYATGEFAGYYGADIAFYELANNINCFEDFKDKMERQPVQSFWTFAIEEGVAIHTRDLGKIKRWRWY